MEMKNGKPVFSIFESEEELLERKINGLREMMSLSREVLNLVTGLGKASKSAVDCSTPLKEMEVYHFLGDVDSVNRRMRDITYYLRSQLDKVIA